MSKDTSNGLRERKKRETRERIVEKSLELFFSKGFEQTTLDEIALAANISRRTFFYYFKSKEDVLLAKYDELLDELRVVMLKEAINQSPFDAAKSCLLKMASLYVTKETVDLDRVISSSESLRKRKEVFNLDMEHVLAELLCELWPAEEQSSLRLIAMIVIGTVRISQDSWRQEQGRYPLAHYLEHNFALLQNQF